MKKSATALAGIKAIFGALILTLLVGLLLGGSNWVSEWLVSPLCCLGFQRVCDAARFWATYWFLIYVSLYEPLQWAFLVLLIRWFAKRGFRLHTAGFICILYGSIMLVGTLVCLAMGVSGFDTEAMVDLILGTLLTSLGLFLWLRPARTSFEDGLAGG